MVFMIETLCAFHTSKLIFNFKNNSTSMKDFSQIIEKFKQDDPKGFKNLLVPHTYSLTYIGNPGIDGSSFASFDVALTCLQKLAQFKGKYEGKFFELEITIYNIFSDVLPLSTEQIKKIKDVQDIIPTLENGWESARKEVRASAEQNAPSKSIWCAPIGGEATAWYIKQMMGEGD